MVSIPVIRHEDYQRFRDVVGDDLDWPATFDEWSDRSNKIAAKHLERGTTFERVVVDFDEFDRWCRTTGQNKNVASFGVFISSRSRNK